MAQRVVLEFVDDLDGSEAIETVRFSLDSGSYEIDLNAGHAIELRDFLERFRSAGRRTGGRVAKQPTAAATVADTKTIRRWAVENSVPVNPRGRIKDDVVRQFEAANA
ncbi:Lsr2 family protein [Pseudarthrobacter sp. PH31-O2]|uniref:histone-like nucleoid-structuring protein Lsr2 n=1 Tax=Pseudarthrobacter sp. PH31-O2 TaxID=3046206 RepID=UPI0024B986EB|nr:Lsr2 family protein [Pseudarthrobacter sp. PH31-O2]MDJ0354420.1 Lsr2 family protein [Pseudarthrobacter sp. PH31-O2]